MQVKSRILYLHILWILTNCSGEGVYAWDVGEVVLCLVPGYGLMFLYGCFAWLPCLWGLYCFKGRGYTVVRSLVLLW